jgi:hypothetical protein
VINADLAGAGPAAGALAGLADFLTGAWQSSPVLALHVRALKDGFVLLCSY